MNIISRMLIVVCFVSVNVMAYAEDKPVQDSGKANGETGVGTSEMTAEQILDAVDRNLTFSTRTARVVMTVEGRRTRRYEMVSYGRGAEDAAIEYLSPARERGTRMLKLEDEVWLFMPSVDRVQRISGHMMRQGMMGSDLSYEDMMTSRELREMYDATILGTETTDGRESWKLEMIATGVDVTYPRRLMWIDKETYIPLRQELYALSGMLLKSWTMSEAREYAGGRVFPSKMRVEDHVRRGSVTTVEFKDIAFEVELEQEVFSLRWLERR